MKALPKALSTSLKILITLGVLLLIVQRLGFATISHAIMAANPFWIWCAIGLFVVSIGLGAIQWHILLSSRGITLPWGRTVSLYFIGTFFNNFMLGLVAGDAVRIAYIKMNNHSGTKSIAATFLDRFAGLWAMMGFAVAGSCVLLAKGMVDGRALTTAIIALIVTFIAFTGLLLFLVSTRLQKIFLPILHSIPFPGHKQIKAIVHQALLEKTNLRLIVLVGLISTIVQVQRIGVHILCGMSLGLVGMHNFQYFFIFVPILAILMIVPLPFGVREALGGGLFALAGFTPHGAIVMEFLASLVGIIASLAGGVFFITGKIKSQNPLSPDIVTKAHNP